MQVKPACGEVLSKAPREGDSIFKDNADMDRVDSGLKHNIHHNGKAAALSGRFTMKTVTEELKRHHIALRVHYSAKAQNAASLMVQNNGSVQSMTTRTMVHQLDPALRAKVEVAFPDLLFFAFSLNLLLTLIGCW